MLFLGVWYPAGLCSAGYDTPQDFVKRGIRPRRTSVCRKMYTTLSLFCGVWYPARLSSVGSDTQQGLVLQDFVLRGIRPRWQIKTPQNLTSFESLPFSLKGHFSKIVSMYKLHYPRHIGSMLKEPPILTFFVCFQGVWYPTEQLWNSNISENSNQISKMFYGMN
jgi:hypothetical protein